MRYELKIAFKNRFYVNEKERNISSICRPQPDCLIS